MTERIPPATLDRLAQVVVGFAGDFPASRAPLCEPAAHSDALDWPALDRGASALTIYTSGSSGKPVAVTRQLAQLFDEVAALAACFDARIGAATVCATVSQQHIEVGDFSAHTAIGLTERVARGEYIAIAGYATMYAALVAMYGDLRERIALVVEDRALDADLHPLIGAIRDEAWALHDA